MVKETLLPSTIEIASPTPTSPAKSTISPHIKYTLTAKLEYLNYSAAVEETIVYTNTTGVPLPDLVLDVEPNRYPGAFLLDSITMMDGSSIGTYSLEKNRLQIPLPQPLAPRASIKLELSYRLSMPEIPPPADTTRPVPFGYTQRQINLVDWYPFIPPYNPTQGWLVHKPWYYGEHQVYDIADYQVNLQVTAGGLKPVIAASALPQQDGGWLRYHLEQARSFALSAGLEYVVSTRQVGNITVLSYAFPYDKKAGEAALNETVDALILFSRLYGEYPFRSLTVVEADFLDGMEYQGLYFLSRGFYNLYDGTHKGYLTAIAVHETAHQWWYGQVGNDQALEPWLDEALCTYSEKLFYEQTYPDLVNWWWDFRVNFYQPEGPVNGQIYDFNGFRPYVNAVYLRGALFLEELRKEVGDQTFFAFVKDYAVHEKGSISSSKEFFTLLSTHSSVDLSDLMGRYFISSER